MMVKTSGIREKVRSRVLEELAKERASSLKPNSKKLKLDEEKDDGKYMDDSEEEQERHQAKATTSSSSSLLSMLPRPRESNGRTIRLDKLLKMPERADKPEPVPEAEEHQFKAIHRDTSSLDAMRSVVVVPKGKEKQKNQITYLAQLGKAKELEHKESAAISRLNKAATRSKYGW